jgi:cholinesterase
MYAYAWTKDPIINGIIAQSGAAGGSRGSSGQSPNQLWYSITSKVGCGGAELGEKTVFCMKQKSSKEIMSAMVATVSSPGITPFGPSADGKTVFADTADRGAKGDFAKIVSAD